MSVVIILGTRPEIIKLAPIIREYERRNQSFTLIHTGQHYSDSLNSVFFEQLDLPKPDYHLGIGSATHGKQTGKMLIQLEEILLKDEPDVVYVQGDTNTVLAGAIASSKLDCELAHVEAGLRSFDRNMPEEINRVITDHVSDYLFVPTEQSKKHLIKEGCMKENIYVTGNTIVDSLLKNRDIAYNKSSILTKLGIHDEDYFLMTAHRAENVDNKDRFQNIIQGVDKVASEYNVEIIYPIHPRAKNSIREFEIDISNQIRLIEPQEYLDFLMLEANADLILTDSGGVQEEACVLQVPCVTMRDNTERPETVEVGANSLCGTAPKDILKSSKNMVEKNTTWENPLGDGTSSEQIIDIVSKKQHKT